MQPPLDGAVASVHVVSLRAVGSAAGKKVVLPATWEELLELASAKVLSGGRVGTISTANGDELVRATRRRPARECDLM